MWSLAKALSAPLLAFGLMIGLSGCGFEPMYGEHTAVAGSTARLSDVRIDTIADRPGQILRNYLLDRTQPAGGTPTGQRYALSVSVSEKRIDLGIARDASTELSQLLVTASFVLTEIQGGKEIGRGQVQSRASYNFVRGGYPTMAADSDARERALRQAGDEIVQRLALMLRRSNKVEKPAS